MKNFRRIYLYRDSDMPQQGWQQACFMCYSITARLLDYKTVETYSKRSNYVVYMCGYCQKQLQIKPEKHTRYVMRCEDYITSNAL